MKLLTSAVELLCTGSTKPPSVSRRIIASIGLAIVSTTVQAANLPPDPATAVPPPVASPFLYSDTQVSYWHEFSGTLVGVATHINKNFVSITHSDAWAYGTNFVNLDASKSTGGIDVANNQPPGGDGLADYYAVWRSTLSFNALSRTKAFSGGPVKDVSAYFGADWGTQNNAFASNTRKGVAGVQVAFDVPGYLLLGIVGVKEANNNGITDACFCIGKKVNFDPYWGVEVSYMQPLTFTGLPLRFSGFTTIYGRKGADGFGVPTKEEVLSDNRLTLDVGKLAAQRANWIDTFVGYRYWRNKFGSDSAIEHPANESTVYLGMAWHAL